MSKYNPRYIENGLLVVGEESWAWWKISRVSAQFRTVDKYEAVATRLSRALESITPEGKGLRVQFRVVRTEFDTEVWRKNLDEYSTPPPGAEKLYEWYTGLMQEHIRSREFMDSELYLGVCLPGQKDEASLRGGLAQARHLIGSFTNGNDLAPTEEELATTRGVAKAFETELSLTLEEEDGLGKALIPATARELVWLIRKPYHNVHDCPIDDIPDLAFFSGDMINTLVNSHIDIEPRSLRVHSPDSDFWTSFASISKFPSTIQWPEQTSWLGHITALEPDAEVCINATIVRAGTVVARLKDLRSSVGEEHREAFEAGTSDREDLDYQLGSVDAKLKNAQNNQTGWVDMTVRVQLRGETEKELDTIMVRLRKRLLEHGYIFNAPAFKQVELLNESLPAGKWARGLHSISLDLDAVGASGCMLSFDVGTPECEGMYTGYNVYGESRPVFSNPNYATQTNRPPGTIIVGIPGSGKSSAALTMAFQSFLMGHTVALIDPKSDTDRLATWLGPEFVRYIDMTQEESGLLDPFLMMSALAGDTGEDADPNAAISSVLGVCVTLLNLKNEREHKDAVSDAIRTVIDAQLAGGRKACMSALVDYMSASTDRITRSLGAELAGFRSDAYGRLLFSNGESSLKPAKGKFTIITLNGLNIPDPEAPKDEYGPSELLALSVMYLVMMYVQRMMMSDSLTQAAGQRIQSRKTIFIDESWAIFSIPEGRSACLSILRLGRSMGTGSVFITQRLTDVPNANNFASTIMAFGCADSDIDDYITTLDMSIDPEIVKSLRAKKNKGSCLISDVERRRGVMRTELWCDEFSAVIDTTPGAPPPPPRRR
jgi:hypothetical protein